MNRKRFVTFYCVLLRLISLVLGWFGSCSWSGTESGLMHILFMCAGLSCADLLYRSPMPASFNGKMRYRFSCVNIFLTHHPFQLFTNIARYQEQHRASRRCLADSPVLLRCWFAQWRNIVSSEPNGRLFNTDLVAKQFIIKCTLINEFILTNLSHFGCCWLDTRLDALLDMPVNVGRYRGC